MYGKVFYWVVKKLINFILKTMGILMQSTNRLPRCVYVPWHIFCLSVFLPVFVTNKWDSSVRLVNFTINCFVSHTAASRKLLFWNSDKNVTKIRTDVISGYNQHCLYVCRRGRSGWLVIYSKTWSSTLIVPATSQSV